MLAQPLIGLIKPLLPFLLANQSEYQLEIRCHGGCL